MKLTSPKKRFYLFLRISMRENYEDYVPERDPITKETAQESEDLHDDVLASFDDE